MIQPLDLIFFRGSELVSKTITRLERNVLHIPLEYMVWSHVGLVVSRAILDLPDMKKGKLYVLESTWSYRYFGDGVLPVDGKRFGIQIRSLDELLQHYVSCKGMYIGHAKMKREQRNQLDLTRCRKVLTSLYERRYRNRRYDFHPISIGASIFPSLRPLRKVKRVLHLKQSKFFFCSELVVDVLLQLQILPDDVNPRDALPMDLVGFDLDNLPSIYHMPHRFCLASMEVRVSSQGPFFEKFHESDFETFT